MPTRNARVSKRLDGTVLSKLAHPDDDSIEVLAVPPVERAKGERAARRKARTIGPKGPAKHLEREQVAAVMEWIARNDPYPEVTLLMFLLSFCAALRVSEIQGLSWRDVTDAEGRLAPMIRFIGKGGKRREVPMDPNIARALIAFHRRHPAAERFAICGKTGELRSVNALTVWFHRKYKEMQLSGCSSHSGRRSLLTHLARNCGRVGKSIRDVQMIAGHARLETTEAYIQPSDDLHELIRSAPLLEQEVDLSSSAGPRLVLAPPRRALPLWGHDPITRVPFIPRVGDFA
jgi:integrase/recombinase XerD